MGAWPWVVAVVLAMGATGCKDEGVSCIHLKGEPVAAEGYLNCRDTLGECSAELEAGPYNDAFECVPIKKALGTDHGFCMDRDFLSHVSRGCLATETECQAIETRDAREYPHYKVVRSCFKIGP